MHDTQSTLAQLCDHVLPVQSEQELEPKGYAATTSTIVISATCDAISSLVLEETGNTPDNLGQTHPGGAVGMALEVEPSGEGGAT